MLSLDLPGLLLSHSYSFFPSNSFLSFFPLLSFPPLSSYYTAMATTQPLYTLTQAHKEAPDNIEYYY